MNNLIHEGLIGLAAAAALLPPRRGKKTSRTTLWRWIADGKNGVRLEGVRRPDGSWLTTADALGRFLARLTEASPCPGEPDYSYAFQTRCQVEEAEPHCPEGEPEVTTPQAGSS